MRSTPSLVLPVLLTACGVDHEWDPESTLCGTVEVADSGCDEGTLPQTVDIWTILEGSQACTTDSWGNPSMAWGDEVVAEPEVDGDGFFEAVLDPGDYGITAELDDCQVCDPVTVDGEGCTEVDLTLERVVYADAPNVYLYPEEPSMVRVSVASPRSITASDPPYGQGWDVLAWPDGRLGGAFGERDFLFYELSLTGRALQREEGFCVAGPLALASMEAVMEDAGFLPNEIADFSAFWDAWFPSAAVLTIYPQVTLPALRIRPAPDTLLRLWFAVRRGCHPVDEPVLPRVERLGFHAAEWGVAILPPLAGADVIVTGW